MPQEQTQYESLSTDEQNSLSNARLKSELASERVRTAISQKETAEAHYQNLTLILAIRHGLSEGDVIDEDGTITRNSDAKPNE